MRFAQFRNFRPLHAHACAALALAGLSACSAGTTTTGASGSPQSSVGPHPTLPEPQRQLLPTVKVAKAVGWPDGQKPAAAQDVRVSAFATGLVHPRWLYTLPNGDVLVAESNAPARPEDGKGLKGAVMKKLQARAGAGVPSPDRITLLRDSDDDGVVDIRNVFIDNLHSPFGMALVGSTLYVANTDAIVAFPYRTGETSISGRGATFTQLPAGARNHHWTKNLIATRDGRKLYVTVGSNSNVAENGMDAEAGRAAIWEVDLASGSKRVFASGMRNPNGMAWEPTTGALWTVVNERDELGDDLVPDYLTSVKDGGFYGWPFSYYGRHRDPRIDAPGGEVERALQPDYALGAHVAALGLLWSSGPALPARFSGGMFVSEHGSWNRSPPVGYKVVFVPFRNGTPSGPPLDVLNGFLSSKGEAWGRPVGLAFDKRGALLVADDVGNAVWRASGR